MKYFYSSFRIILIIATLFTGIIIPNTASAQGTVIGGVDMGNLTNYLFFFADGNDDANWQSASKGFAGDVAVDGLQADERTSGDLAFAGTIYTNDADAGDWEDILDNNIGQANASYGESGRIAALEEDLAHAFAQINALEPTPGYEDISSIDLDGMDTENGLADVYVINITEKLEVKSSIYITGDANDVFIFRWDDDGDPSNGYQGKTKFQSGGGLVPLGGLKASNFIHVAGEMTSSGGGENPGEPFPQGPRPEDGTGDLIEGGEDFSGGGFFTGYWLTTGKPDDGKNGSFSNAIFVGGWYTTATKFSMTSGTSGVHVSPNTPESNCVDEGIDPFTNAVFTADNQRVMITSNLPIRRIVLEFESGIPESLDNLFEFAGSYGGSGENEGRCLVGVYIYTGCYDEMATRMYSDYFANMQWSGTCAGDQPSDEYTNVHYSTVIFNKSDSDLLATQIESKHTVVYPNPVRSSGILMIDGLEGEEARMSLFNVTGRQMANMVITHSSLDLSSYHLMPGIYLLMIERGSEMDSFRVVVQD